MKVREKKIWPRYQRVLSLIISCLIFSILTGWQSYSQKLNDISAVKAIRDFKEMVFIRTDRDIYITGEEVFLKAYKLNGLLHTPSDLSKVVYIEMLDNNNFPIKQVKVKTDFSGSTSFVIPGNISSGNYLIRAYTRWMENFSIDQFFYKAISVINPFETIDHLKIPESGRAVNHSYTRITDREGKILNVSTFLDNSEKIIYKINLSKNDYQPREKVTIQISATDRVGKPVEADMSVSVTKSVVSAPDPAESFYFLNQSNSPNSTRERTEQLAELEGHLISGSLRSKTNNEPLKNTDLSLSYVGKTARCQFGKTDDNGVFNFIVKESGINEIVIQPMSPDITGYYVELIQPFSSSFSDFRTEVLYLDSSKVEELNKVIIGMQIDNIYQPYRQSIPVETNYSIPDFYGKPENTVKMSDYIELTSLREVVKEIIPNVYTLRQNGRYDFKLINKFRGQPFENKPLVLIDGVPVYDFEKVLNINSKEIERADIINTRYFFSENVFDGIVSFITKKGNLSILDFDNSIFRQVYEGCQLPKKFYSPDYNSDQDKNKRIPDYRNTLYWKPDLKTGKDGKAIAEFYASDEKVSYTIVIEGITRDGKIGYSSSVFNVK